MSNVQRSERALILFDTPNRINAVVASLPKREMSKKLKCMKMYETDYNKRSHRSQKLKYFNFFAAIASKCQMFSDRARVDSV